MTKHETDFRNGVATPEVSRRAFIITAAAAGGGMVLGISSATEAQATNTTGYPGVQTKAPEFTNHISITPDNKVIVRATKMEIGNGVLTSIAMIATEELGCDWSTVSAEYVLPSRNLAENNVYSKTGVLAYFAGRSTGKEMMDQMLQAGASARERLKAAAAQKWNVPAGEIKAEKSMLIHEASGKKATYGEMAEAAAAVKLDKEPAPKPHSQWTFLTKTSQKRLNLPLILDGSAKYGIDIQVPGMVYATVRHVPSHGGRLKSYNFEAIKAMPGVRAVVVIDPDEKRAGLPGNAVAPMGFSATTNGPQAAVAVIADHYWQAKVALDLLPIEWDPGEGKQWTNTAKVYETIAAAAKDAGKGNIIRQIGDVDAALKDGKKVEAEFMTPYNDHFLMEPLNGTALVTADKVEVWVPTQHPQQAMYVTADETGVPPEKVTVYPTYVGMGCGRRIYGDDVRTVVAIAKKVQGTPVKVIWTREEMTRQGRYRDLAAASFTATLGPDGMPKAVDINQAATRSSGRNLSDTPYATNIPNFRVRTKVFNTNLMTGPFRGPMYTSNLFFLETFINQLAETAKIDAVEYRRKLLANYPDPGWVKVLDEVAQKANWGQSLPKGTAQGVAIGNWAMANTKEGAPVPNTGSTVAAIVMVEVSRRGQVSIPRVDIAMDLGTVMNQEGVRAQMEGGVIMGLSAGLLEEININNGAVVEGNLDTYRVLRQNDPLLPQEIHVHFGGNTNHERLSEAGEPPMGPPPAAFAHAYFKATGKWLTRQPLTKYMA
ncbi:molybdopterin-dependent oxidoreductase [Alsobacter sp. SYSU M60028]|uniref:Molybdopterin-dependent oxidoreductase n=1 Tax=Alsobacter ponti TaxID=2962936 RepID=A0ABT1LHH8_9HYPH|nr:molybdopterin cofactor-binding domain-containing protein [Alsobacter ponti]MCP8940962.1 molybdopterin-dependent oxidoreductase [Alsobacter ponti]